MPEYLAPGVQPTTLEFGVRARFPGSAGNGRMTITLALGRKQLSRGTDGRVTLSGATDRDIVWVRNASGTGRKFRILLRDTLNQTRRLGDGSTEVLAGLDELQTRFSIPVAPATDVLDVRTLTATVTVEATSGDLPAFVATVLALEPAHMLGHSRFALRLCR